MNANQCKHIGSSNGYEGGPLYTKVVTGTAIVNAIVFLMLLAARRDVRAAMENPVHSTMFLYHLVTQVETALAMTSAIAYRCAYSSAPFGTRYFQGLPVPCHWQMDPRGGRTMPVSRWHPHTPGHEEDRIGWENKMHWHQKHSPGVRRIPSGSRSEDRCMCHSWATTPARQLCPC